MSEDEFEVESWAAFPVTPGASPRKIVATVNGVPVDEVLSGKLGVVDLSSEAEITPSDCPPEDQATFTGSDHQEGWVVIHELLTVREQFCEVIEEVRVAANPPSPMDMNNPMDGTHE